MIIKVLAGLKPLLNDASNVDTATVVAFSQ